MNPYGPPNTPINLPLSSVALRCRTPGPQVPSLTVGGALWFSDLTEADPYFGLPIMCTAVTLAMVEYGINLAGDAGPMPAERQNMTKGLKWLLRGLAFMFIPAGSYVAAGTAVLWVSNTAFGVVQGLVLRNPGFRKRVGLPTMEVSGGG